MRPLSQLDGPSETPGGVSVTVGRGVGRGSRVGLGTKQMKMVVPLVLLLNLCKFQHLISKSGDNCASAFHMRAETKVL